MPLLRQTIQVGICVRHCLVNNHLAYSQVSHNHLVTRNIHRFVPTKFKPCSMSNFNRSLFTLNSRVNLGSLCKFSNGAFFFFQALKSSSIRERIYDNLILFTHMLHKQSNVYMCLRLRRLTQICNLYQRLYSPYDFKNLFIDRILDRLRYFGLLIQRRSSFLKSFLYRHRLVLSFSSVGLFSWEENRITDHELQHLLKEFMIIENCQEKSLNNDCGSYFPARFEEDKPTLVTKSSSEDTSFMVVQATQKSQENWEEVINRPNFHVWRKSVSNTSLYEYKVFGSFVDISAYSFYTVQRDLDFRKEWDKLVLKLDIVEVEPEYVISNANKNIDDSGNELVHWIMKYPYPMKSREYLFVRRSQIDYENKFIVLVSRSVPYSDIPESEEHVRVHDYTSQMVIRPHQDDFYQFGFDYMLTYFDDPRASFPSPAYNWMASRGVPDFVEKMHQAALSLSLKKPSVVIFTTPEDSTNCTLLQHCEETRISEVKPKQEQDIENNSSALNSTNASISQTSEHTDVGSNFQSSSLNNTSTNDRSRKNNKSKEANTFSFKSLNIWN